MISIGVKIKDNARTGNKLISSLFLLATSLSYYSVSITATSVSSSHSDTISKGLQNPGNICYLNAQLQCAFHIPLVRNLILSSSSQYQIQYSPLESTENVDNLSTTTSSESIALLSLKRLFEDMQVSETAANPRLLCQDLGIPMMVQQDSQEFWKLLLPALELRPLTDLYQGAFEDYISALDGSGRERNREEAFLDLSLDVTSGSAIGSLQKMFGTAELLSVSEGNGWRPEKGADKVDALKGSLLRAQGLPSILQLHLKRFNYDWNTDTTSKINTQLTFPAVLDLSEVCADVDNQDERESTIYDLQSVLIHFGEYESGHYYSYVRPNLKSNIWYRFNDHVVTKVSYEEVAADSFGGKYGSCTSNSSVKSSERNLISSLLNSIKSALTSGSGDSYGWGGKTSNAYVLQYVKRCDIPTLYDTV